MPQPGQYGYAPQQVPLTNEEHQMIFAHNFGINFRSKTKSGPDNDWNSILTCMCMVFFSFAFAWTAMIVPAPFSWLCWFAIAVILFFRIATLTMFIWAVIAGRYCRRFYVPSIFFWGWWPIFLCFFCITATVCGAATGSYLNEKYLSPYLQLKKLQMYRDVNPNKVPGVRVQDAGIIEFAEFVKPNRGKGGCFMNAGNTYCVAPITYGGEVAYDLAGTPLTGSYDYFAVGMNCCSCPNRDWKCPGYNNPLANGGLRSLDEKARPFYNLALSDWKASYQKSSKTPMFFEWTQDPEWQWKVMWNDFFHMSIFAWAIGLSMALTIGFFMEKLLQILWHYDIVVPRVCLAPAPFCEIVSMILLPKMYYRYQQEQTDIATMPVFSQSFRAERHDNQDDRRVQQEYGSMSRGMLKNGLTNAALNSIMAPAGANRAGGIDFY